MLRTDLNRDQYDHAIDQWILGRNAERDRLILKMYLFEGITYKNMLLRLEKMAEDMKDPSYYIGEDRLKQVIRKRKKELYSHI